MNFDIGDKVTWVTRYPGNDIKSIIVGWYKLDTPSNRRYFILTSFGDIANTLSFIKDCYIAPLYMNERVSLVFGPNLVAKCKWCSE